MKMKASILVIVGAILAVGCGFADGQRKGQDAVETFHRQLNAARYSDIYASATPAFRSSGPETDVAAYLGGVHRKLGAFKTATLGSTMVNASTSGTFIRQTYESEFEQGAAVEEFTFLLSGDQAALHAYNINSRALVMK